MEKYNGKLVYYSDNLTTPEKRDFYNALPIRSDFIDKKANETIRNKIVAKQDILFHSNDILETHYKEDGRLHYKLIFGVLRDGSKAAVILNDIEIYFELKVPADANTYSFTEEIRNLLISNKIFIDNITTVSKKPFKLFNEKNVDYLRITFNTLNQRQKALGIICFQHECRERPWVKNTIITYTNKTGNISKLNTRDNKSITAEDDSTYRGRNYYRKVARNYKINIAGWNTISKYRIVTNNGIIKDKCVPYIFSTNVYNMKDIENIIDPSIQPEYKDLLFDKSIVCGWDLETYSVHPCGNIPLPENVEVNGREEDLIFLDCMPFFWQYTPKPLITVAISVMPSPPRDDCMIIICNNQVELIKIKALLVERMTPEFVCGFNDGCYDWPFIINRAEKFNGLLDFIKNRMSVIHYTEEHKKFCITGARNEKIKMEAGLNHEMIIFDVPGFICIDVRGVFMKMFPKAEKTTLNFFLAANKLGSKEDMPYKTMFRIYRITRYFKAQGLNTWSDMMDYANQICAEFGGEYKILEKIINVDEGTYGVEKFTTTEVIEHLELVTQVINYCNVDSGRCQDLLTVRNIIPDKRGVAKLSYTAMYDAVFRADGMKVRNLVAAHACMPEWNLACSNISGGTKDDRKYPGAYVVPPVKGLYRDHSLVKDKRRNKKDARFDIESVTPTSETFSKEPVNDQSDEMSYTLKNMGHLSNDENHKNDRPCTGLDFSSLYPSLMMTYNLSPEKFVTNINEVERLKKLGYELLPVEFLYGLKDQPDNQKEVIKAWVIQHTHPMRHVLMEAVAKAKSQAATNWHRLIDPALIARVQKAYKETTLSQWREYGMGLYPYILKDLFDRRSKIKTNMNYYHEPKEFMENVFSGVLKMEEFAKLPNQLEFMLEQCDIEISKRETAALSGKPFHKWKLHAAKEIKEFFVKEWKSDFDINKLYSECSFKVAYYNTNQGALKVYMNTFYGETGNQLSAFFLVSIAGGITSWGQYNTKMVKEFVTEQKYTVLYGDTDSLYINCPEALFDDVDNAYITGKISKLEYWTAMIEITMENLDKFKDEVNLILLLDNYSPFLKMAYEEVLYPFALLGKKKYIGIAHEGLVNLAACLAACTLEDFIKSRTLFIRGLEIIKRGSSDLLKNICYSIFHRGFNIGETRTLKQIIDDKLEELVKQKWDPTMFIKTAKYKLPGMNNETGKMKPGNVSVLSFINRMITLTETNPTLGIKIPEVGDRFPYVIVKRYPWRYDMKGRQQNLKMGDKYEFIESLQNEKYQAIVGELEIDMDYYVTNEIIGQFSRFIIYHKDYDIEYKPNMTDEEYKKADKKAWEYAKKKLTDYYNLKYSTKYQKKGKLYKKIAKQTTGILKSKINDVYGNSGDLINITNEINTISDVDVNNSMIYSDIYNKIISQANKVAFKLVSPINVKQFISGDGTELSKLSRKITVDPHILIIRCINNKLSYYQIHKRNMEVRKEELMRELKKNIPEIKNLSDNTLKTYMDAIETIIDHLELDKLGSQPAE